MTEGHGGVVLSMLERQSRDLLSSITGFAQPIFMLHYFQFINWTVMGGRRNHNLPLSAKEL